MRVERDEPGLHMREEAVPPVISGGGVIVGRYQEREHLLDQAFAISDRFTVLRNFWSDARIGSGLMAWDCGLSAIYERFLLAPERAMREYVTTERWGDQGFIKAHTPVPLDFWQVKHPGRPQPNPYRTADADGSGEAAAVAGGLPGHTTTRVPTFTRV